MTARSKIIVTLALILGLSGLAAADYYAGGSYTADVGNDEQNATPPEGAVAKHTGPDVKMMIEKEGLSSAESDDLSLLIQIVKDGTSVQSLAILANGDRAGSVTWVESGNVKTYFVTLKDALLNTFSSQVRDLRDETFQESGKPVRNVLTFIDPSISSEQVMFVRVRERLYEFHIAEGKEETMNLFINELTSN